MDFNDTPEEAAFRGEVRAWLDANATRKSDDRESLRARNDDPELLKKAKEWQDKKAKLEVAVGTGGKGAMKIRDFLMSHPEYAGGTIGAVALDAHGVLCACTSTGGVTLKLVGRVGDTPLPGCGTYASKFAASSATGTGEYVIRALACRQISDNVEKGMSLKAGIDAVLDGLGRDFDADVGFIGIDAQGHVVGAHRTPHMPHAWFSGSADIVAKMKQ